MVSDKMKKLLNEQINKELASAYLYYSMSAWLNGRDLPGFANWMHVQALEELVHADKFFGFMVERGCKVTLEQIDKQQVEWKSAAEVFKHVLEHELLVTASINALVTLARKENDHATDNFLQWFVAEQVEEEASAEKIIKQLKMLDKAPGGLYLLDKELAARVFVPPAAPVA